MTDKSQSQILVVNAGGQYCHLIARRVRESGVQARICMPERSVDNLKNVKGVIISGGPNSVYADGHPVFPDKLFKSGIPLLGICYGHQVLANAFGGHVEPGRVQEYGETLLEIIGQDTILQGLKTNEPVWMSHGDEVISAPDGFQVLARSENCKVAAMANIKQKLFGVQFHPEVEHTPCGKQIIDNFLFKVCGCELDWEIKGLVSRLEQEIRNQVGERHVLFFVSGGVDSTVAFALCTDAISPERVTGIFVDTGFMRKGEREEIEVAFSEKGWNNIRFVDASKKFLDRIKDVSNPEVKRQIIGDCFLEVQREQEVLLGLSSGRWMLGQGTIYPDTIESGGNGKAAVIKTHHNRVPAIENLIKEGLVLEPLRDFYKDEVRDIGRQIGLPEEIVSKNPFPGPGLAVRCLCSDANHKIVETDFGNTFGLKSWSVPICTVGVQGDHRSYSNLVILSGGNDLSTFSNASRKITREIRDTNRVAFLVDPKDDQVMKNAYVCRKMITKERLDLLREADAFSATLLKQEGLAAEIWQFPVVLLPLTVGHGETIALRPVLSSDAMTARHADLPLGFIRRLGQKLKAIDGVDLVLYDVTDKPPATIEWE